MDREPEPGTGTKQARDPRQMQKSKGNSVDTLEDRAPHQYFFLSERQNTASSHFLSAFLYQPVVSQRHTRNQQATRRDMLLTS